jgi:membrane-bound ClpP family serine protease
MSSQLWKEGLEGVRPLAAPVAVLFLGVAAMMFSVTARWLAPRLARASLLVPRLTALRLLGPRPMWLFLAVAGVALVSASAAVTAL